METGECSKRQLLVLSVKGSTRDSTNPVLRNSQVAHLHSRSFMVLFTGFVLAVLPTWILLPRLAKVAGVNHPGRQLQLVPQLLQSNLLPPLLLTPDPHPPPRAPPPVRVRISLRYLGMACLSPQVSEGCIFQPSGAPPVSPATAPVPPPHPPHPLIVQCGVPFLWGKSRSTAQSKAIVDCELCLKGECLHCISGKANGGCKNFHRKICPRFLK